MREVKYKAWLLDEKAMVDVITINLQDKWIGYYDLTDCKNGAEAFEIMRSGKPNADCAFERCVLMQYTGLKDRNGMEIYEGSVLEQEYQTCSGNAHDGTDVVHSGYHRGVVSIVPSRGVVMKNPLRYDEETGETTISNQYKQVVGYRSKVIGNIYQIPKLRGEDSQCVTATEQE